MSDATATYRAKNQQPSTVKVFQAKVVYDSNGRATRVPGELLQTFVVTGSSVDQRRSAALAKAKASTGSSRVSISCTTDGGFAVTVPPKM